jgi:hypothetical protein
MPQVIESPAEMRATGAADRTYTFRTVEVETVPCVTVQVSV